MLDPYAQAVIDKVAAAGLPPSHQLAPIDLRGVYAERCRNSQPPSDSIEMAQVLDMQAPGAAGHIAVRLYRPHDATRSSATAPWPLLVFFHGGGWTIGDLDTHDLPCRLLAKGAGCLVLSVAYRLAPEHPFPAPLDDCLAVTQWARQQANAWGADASRLAVGGDSAGGNLAAVCAIAMRDGGLSLAFQLLVYPVTDQRAVAPSHTRNAQGYLLTGDTMAYYRGHYLPSPALWTDWRASPLLASSHAKLAPALVITAGYDPLCDEGRQYADALSTAGTPCEYACFERQIHGFFAMSKLIPEAHGAMALATSALRRAFDAV